MYLPVEIIYEICKHDYELWKKMMITVKEFYIYNNNEYIKQYRKSLFLKNYIIDIDYYIDKYRVTLHCHFYNKKDPYNHLCFMKFPYRMEKYRQTRTLNNADKQKYDFVVTKYCGWGSRHNDEKEKDTYYSLKDIHLLSIEAREFIYQAENKILNNKQSILNFIISRVNI